MKKIRENKEFTIAIIQSDEPEHILEENYQRGMQYAISVLRKLNDKKDNKVPKDY